MIEVDGGRGEGGGQLLRMALALSALTDTPVRVARIRAGRPTPGLAAQHVTAINAVAALCEAEVTGVSVGASSIEFRPGKLAAGRFSFDVGTAGSTTLVLQALLPVAAAAPGAVRVRLIGGTDVRWSPPIDDFNRVFLPLLLSLGADSLAERGKRSERIGEEAATSLGAEIESQATLDVHAADQLLVYLARAGGPSWFRVRSVSGHLETMMWLIPQFLPSRFAVTRERGGCEVSVEPGA